MNHNSSFENEEYAFAERPKAIKTRTPSKQISREEWLSQEKVEHGTSIHSLFLLLVLGAMTGVFLREISIHGLEPSIPRDAIIAIYVVLIGIGLAVSVGVAVVWRLTAVQAALRAVAGFFVGGAAATLSLVPNSSLWTVSLTTAFGSVGLVAIAALMARSSRNRSMQESSTIGNESTNPLD